MNRYQFCSVVPKSSWIKVFAANIRVFTRYKCIKIHPHCNIRKNIYMFTSQAVTSLKIYNKYCHAIQVIVYNIELKRYTQSYSTHTVPVWITLYRFWIWDLFRVIFELFRLMPQAKTSFKNFLAVKIQKKKIEVRIVSPLTHCIIRTKPMRLYTVYGIFSRIREDSIAT